MKKILLPLSLAAAVMADTDLQSQIDALKAEVETLKTEREQSEEVLVEEIGSLKDAIYSPVDQYESFSSMGAAASKVYYAKSAVSIGGYGEYEIKKYFNYKNYDSDTANDTRNKTEWNIVRFVPYIGFRFSDWIVMNTEIEFEDGGARSDDTKNYKYAIIEFSYIDFLFDPAYALRIGHILVPMGITNLNHEPVAYLTSERPFVETFIIPSTWHTNGALMHGKIENFEYYAGVVTSPDAGRFIEGRFIQQGRLGARQFTDDLSFVARGQYALGNGFDFGGSVLYGNSSILEEDRPGVSTGNSGDAEITISLAEIHATYRNHGFDIKALASYGTLGGDVDELADGTISDAVNGEYITFGYDLLHSFSTAQQLYGVAEIEHLDMDASGTTEYPDNNRFYEYTAGIAYFPDPKVVLKADYAVKDYGPNAKLSDENYLTFQAGFIF